MSNQTQILTATQTRNKLRRIAYQILEVNFNESEVILAGIAGGGHTMATLLQEELEKIGNLKVCMCTIQMDKKNLLASISTDLQPEDYTDKSVIIVDDVLNSGGTLMYATRHFLDVPTKRIKTAVLVNRNHKNYPIKADFKGTSLSTSLQNHVHVDWDTLEVTLR